MAVMMAGEEKKRKKKDDVGQKIYSEDVHTVMRGSRTCQACVTLIVHDICSIVRFHREIALHPLSNK